MRVARYVLRQKLLDALPDAIDARFSLGIDAADKLESGRMRVSLSNGSIDECDLLVAADGANSKIRAELRPEDTLKYAGAVSITATARSTNGGPAPIKQDHGIVISGTDASLFASPIDHHSADWSVSTLQLGPQEYSSREQTREMQNRIIDEARRKGKEFTELFNISLEATAPENLMVLNAMDKSPIDHAEMTGAPVVLTGDSNHAVGEPVIGQATRELTSRRPTGLALRR